MISPNQYREAAYLALEQRTLLSNCWIFVGLRCELAGLRHRGVRVGATEILIQCDKAGAPRAFLNVCAHRHAQLCERGLHTGAVRCPYHGWVYDREGVPVGIPQPQAFPAVVAAPQAHRLTEFSCDAVGEFVFVRLSEAGPTLVEFLGGEAAFLRQASEGVTAVLDEFQGEISANWKVLIENALEGYHVPSVHSQTFMHVEAMQGGSDAPVNDFSHPLHSAMTHPVQAAWLARFKRSIAPKIGLWPNQYAYYTHHHIFPNLTVTSFMGYSFHVQRFDPVAVDRTSVVSQTIGVAFTHQTPSGAKLMARIHEDGHRFTRQVFGEDGAICARVQAGLQQATRLAVLGEGLEDRVAHFQTAYMKATSEEVV